MTDFKKIYLIDLPTFPKGVISLSFPAIAAVLRKDYTVKFIDLNLSDFNRIHIKDFKLGRCFFIGIKVSTQNYYHAIAITKQIKSYNSKLIIVWGGEFPSLLPNEAKLYADTIVCGGFEGVSKTLIDDIRNENVKRMYDGTKTYNCSNIQMPDYSIIKRQSQYSQFMGYPIETSRGCDKKCTFCMVHTMQPLTNFKSIEQLNNELKNLKGKFINVVDYNIGVNKLHLNNIIEAFTNAYHLGWMGEMCLETLDDDELLERLSKSGCKIIYCGLESINKESLVSINKAKTNQINNYTRIIKKVQRHGIQIAAGIIIGLEGSTKESINDTFAFFEKIGIIYAKITFLTYNPGTKVHQSMKRVGTYTKNEVNYFDGNHFSFLPKGVNQHEVLKATGDNIKFFYSDKRIHLRALNAGLEGLAYKEFVNFNYCYREVYLQWMKYKIFDNEHGFPLLLNRKYKKSDRILKAEKDLGLIRKELAKKFT